MIIPVCVSLADIPFKEYLLSLASVPPNHIHPLSTAICTAPFGSPIYHDITFTLVSDIGMYAYVAYSLNMFTSPPLFNPLSSIFSIGLASNIL